MTTIVYGTPHAQCNYCHKWVNLTGLFSGLHVCLTPQERADIDAVHVNQTQRQQAVNFVKQTEISLMQLLGRGNK